MPTPDAGSPTTGDSTLSLPLGDAIVTVVRGAAGLAQSVVDSYSQGATPDQARGLLADLVDVGFTTAGSIAKVLTDGLRSVPSRSAEEPALLPRVHVGATLRLPLVVENTSDSASESIAFSADVLGEGGSPVDGVAVDFSPASLSVGPHDFEKLTVRIAVPLSAAPGPCRALIVGGDGWFVTEVPFLVLADDSTRDDQVPVD